MHRTLASILVLIASLALASPASAAEPAIRKVEGNRPRATVPNEIGRIVLFPDAAEFFGEAIRINPDNACIAWWEKPADYVAWEIESPKAVEYEVWLEWAIADDLAGNGFRIRVGEASLTGKIGKTGGWTSLKRESVGTLKIPAGRSRLEMRVEGPLKGELADVRCITLNPVGSPAPPAAPPVPPKTPASSLNQIRVHPAMQVELVAAEPIVRDPIAIAWGADLKLWVVEMGDYPLGTDGKGGHGGRIKFLEDLDADGHYDKATIFLDDLGFPTGVLPWKKGVLVTCAPEIFYAEDTDGDGRADVRTPLFTGFPERNQQHRVNGLKHGLDGWIYCSNGDGGVGGDTTIVSVATGAKTSLGSRDFRFRPDTGELQTQSGPSQYGRNRDDWGNWFGCNNGQPLYHFALDERALARNPRLKAPDPRVHLFGIEGPFYTLAESVPVHGEQPAKGRRATGLGGACAAMIYRDELLGEEFSGNAFVCDPVTNLVHRRVLAPERSSFSSSRAADEQASEFFASADTWTRPVMVQAGPDGALYVVDMYRLYIEHPQWIAGSIAANADLRAGADRGRIYRIYPADRRPRKPVRLDTLSAAELVAALDSPSGWQRDTARQRLVDLDDPSVLPALERLAASASRPQVRVTALATIAGMNAATDALVGSSLRDPHPAVRRLAVRLTEPRLEASPELDAAIRALARDPDPQVRLQVAASLGESPDPTSGRLLADMILTDRDDPYLVATALSSATRHPGPLVAEVLTAEPPADPRLLAQVLAASAAGDGGEVAAGVAAELESPRLAKSIDRQFALAAALLDAGLPAAGLARGSPALDAVFARARQVVDDPAAAEALRLAAFGLVGRQVAHRGEDLERLADAVSPAVSPAIASAALEGLARTAAPQVGTILVGRCTSLGPALLSRAIQVLVSREEWALALLDGIASEPRLAAAVDPARRQQLLKHPSAKVREAAEKRLGAAGGGDRVRIVSEYASAAEAKGDPARGREVFVAQCAGCHRLQEVGKAVGPDLAGLREKSPRVLLEAILDPNRAVEDKFVAYNVVTQDGRSVTGLVQVESGNSITLAAADGQVHTLLRDDIETFATTGRSLMPEGFEKAIPPERMADLLAFLARP
jgi:putative membrane-bound dehydrogenase-like protein